MEDLVYLTNLRGVARDELQSMDTTSLFRLKKSS